MKVYITYFYNIRFFPTSMIPLSTALYDPKWYHNFNNSSHFFKDKRGIWNGLRIEQLVPYGIEGQDNFLLKYYRLIHKINFSEISQRLTEVIEQVRILNKDNVDYDICLLVHEKPDNPNSERSSIIQLFKEHNIDVIEWTNEKT